MKEFTICILTAAVLVLGYVLHEKSEPSENTIVVTTGALRDVEALKRQGERMCASVRDSEEGRITISWAGVTVYCNDRPPTPADSTGDSR